MYRSDGHTRPDSRVRHNSRHISMNNQQAELNLQQLFAPPPQSRSYAEVVSSSDPIVLGGSTTQSNTAPQETWAGFRFSNNVVPRNRVQESLHNILEGVEDIKSELSDQSYLAIANNLRTVNDYISQNDEPSSPMQIWQPPIQRPISVEMQAAGEAARAAASSRRRARMNARIDSISEISANLIDNHQEHLTHLIEQINNPTTNTDTDSTSSTTADSTSNRTADLASSPTADLASNRTANPTSSTTADLASNPTANPTSSTTADLASNPTVEYITEQITYSFELPTVDVSNQINEGITNSGSLMMALYFLFKWITQDAPLHKIWFGLIFMVWFNISMLATILHIICRLLKFTTSVGTKKLLLFGIFLLEESVIKEARGLPNHHLSILMHLVRTLRNMSENL
jgi:hypothetical protein